MALGADEHAILKGGGTPCAVLDDVVSPRISKGDSMVWAWASGILAERDPEQELRRNTLDKFDVFGTILSKAFIQWCFNH